MWRKAEKALRLGPTGPTRLHQARFVAQIFNLPYRRIAFGGPFE
jgi:hypothetical protein